MFSRAIRSSLVVLPLALPAALAVTPAVVVAQTLVELVGMIAYVRLVPRLLPARDNRADRQPPSQHQTTSPSPEPS